MKKILRVVEVIGTLFIAVPPLILGCILGVMWTSFRQGLSDGKEVVS